MSPSSPDASRHEPTPRRDLVIIPTYNEADNIDSILNRLTAAVPSADVLVVDDASPDGTGRLADAQAAVHDHIHVLHRAGKGGLGAAYLAGFDWALDAGYDVIVEMDADGSHAPEQLPRLLSAMDHADVAIGSRYVAGGTVVNWPWHRQVLSRGANLYARILLGSRVTDMTAGFRAYRADLLRAIDLAAVTSQGYCFQVDLAWRSLQHGATVVEVPITFTEREIGASKMNGAIVREAMVAIARWGVRHRARQVRRLVLGASR